MEEINCNLDAIAHIYIYYDFLREEGKKTVDRREKLKSILTDDDPIERVSQGYRRRRRYEDSKGRKGKAAASRAAT